MEINDIALLKRLAKQAEEKKNDSSLPNEEFRRAYARIAEGSALLWRLIEQSGSSGGKPALRD